MGGCRKDCRCAEKMSRDEASGPEWEEEPGRADQPRAQSPGPRAHWSSSHSSVLPLSSTSCH